MTVPSEPSAPGGSCSRWSELGFQDLNDDEAFCVWAYRCWQMGESEPTLAQHRLAGLLHQERLHKLLQDMFRLFQFIGPDVAMCAHMQACTQLTGREEALLALLCEQDFVQCRNAGDVLAAACREGLRRHSGSLRAPAVIARQAASKW